MLCHRKLTNFPSSSDASINVSVRSTNVSLKMYEGYDWRRTHRVIEEQRKAIRKRLAKLKQVLSSGQTMDMTMDTDPFEGTSALLFNSVHLGLANNGYDDLDDEALLDAIDRELGGEEKELDASWETIRPAPSTSGQSHPSTSNAPSLRRKRNPSVEIVLSNVEATFNQFEPGSELASRVLVTARELEILDHMKSSTWQRFLTSMRTDSLGNLRESDSNMVRVELKTLKVSPTSGMEELRLRAKILPLRLHVDQDALDFFKAFAAFQTPEQMEKNKTQQAEPAGDEEPFFRKSRSMTAQRTVTDRDNRTS
jgi:autophagy-related protein 2